jgi:hypothetical protein
VLKCKKKKKLGNDTHKHRMHAQICDIIQKKKIKILLRKIAFSKLKIRFKSRKRISFEITQETKTCNGWQDYSALIGFD